VRLSEWLVGVLDLEYRVLADTYYRAKVEAVRRYFDGHPGCPHDKTLLCRLASARKLDRLVGRVERLGVE